jgi:hypothetical protein
VTFEYPPTGTLGTRPCMNGSEDAEYDLGMRRRAGVRSERCRVQDCPKLAVRCSEQRCARNEQPTMLRVDERECCASGAAGGSVSDCKLRPGPARVARDAHFVEVAM